MIPALAVLGIVFVLGVSYGLYLNVTHMHRMSIWACKVADKVELAKEAARAIERKALQ